MNGAMDINAYDVLMPSSYSNCSRPISSLLQGDWTVNKEAGYWRQCSTLPKMVHLGYHQILVRWYYQQTGNCPLCTTSTIPNHPYYSLSIAFTQRCTLALLSSSSLLLLLLLFTGVTDSSHWQYLISRYGRHSVHWFRAPTQMRHLFEGGTYFRAVFILGNYLL